MMFPFARVKGWPAVGSADLVAGHSGMSPEEYNHFVRVYKCSVRFL